MTQPEEKTFTQAEVDAIVRERLKRERDATATKYADYDELKTKAATADGNKTQLDKMAEQLAAIGERATKAEAANLRNEVLAAKKVPAKLAGRIRGDTKEELEADADELIATWKEAGGKLDDDTPPATDAPAGKATAPARGRPREALHSGAPLNDAPPEETNPLKLAALIPRN
jgi:hypothetical protein